MWKKIVLILAAATLIITLTPPTLSLANLTGEEQPIAQVRGLWQWWYSALRPQPHPLPLSLARL